MVDAIFINKLSEPSKKIVLAVADKPLDLVETNRGMPQLLARPMGEFEQEAARSGKWFPATALWRGRRTNKVMHELSSATLCVRSSCFCLGPLSSGPLLPFVARAVAGMLARLTFERFASLFTAPAYPNVLEP